MKIQEQDIYHGAALTQIVKHDSFKALNRGSQTYGHYLVNTNIHVLAKYRKNKKSPWTFQINTNDISFFCNTRKATERIFLCLICGQFTICALTQDEIEKLIDVTNPDASQSISVTIPKGGSCHVSGSKGKLGSAVPLNSFPDKIFS